MGKKSKRIKNHPDGIVYSTDPDFSNRIVFPTKERATPSEQDLTVYFDRKRKGKGMTIIEGFVGSDSDLKALAKELKSLCGVGGTAKDNVIMIQGDVRVRVADYLVEQGNQVKMK